MVAIARRNPLAVDITLVKRRFFLFPMAEALALGLVRVEIRCPGVRPGSRPAAVQSGALGGVRCVPATMTGHVQHQQPCHQQGHQCAAHPSAETSSFSV